MRHCSRVPHPGIHGVPNGIRRRELGPKLAGIPHDSSIADAPSRDDDRRKPPNPGEPGRNEALRVDPIEVALADAITAASEAGRWDVVAQLARELEARRTARFGVVDLTKERERRSK